MRRPPTDDDADVAPRPRRAPVVVTRAALERSRAVKRKPPVGERPKRRALPVFFS